MITWEEFSEIASIASDPETGKKLLVIDAGFVVGPVSDYEPTIYFGSTSPGRPRLEMDVDKNTGAWGLRITNNTRDLLTYIKASNIPDVY